MCIDVCIKYVYIINCNNIYIHTLYITYVTNNLHVDIIHACWHRPEMVPEAAPRHKRLATRDTRSLTLPRTTVALSKWAAICRWSSAKPGKALTCQRHWQIAPWNCDHYLSSNSQLFLWGVASSGSLKCIPSSSDPLASFDSSPAQGTFQGFFELACPQFILWNSIDFFMDLNAVWPWIP